MNQAFTPITCIAAYIAYQQYQINRQQLRKSLSEKRLEIYVNEGDIKSEAQRNGEKLNICTNQIKEIRKWFEVQTPSEITSLFYPYINLSNIGIDKNKN